MLIKTLQENIYEFMDFNLRDTHFETVLEEFRNKYVESYVNINGSPEYLSYIGMDHLQFRDTTIKYKDKATISHITLKPGLYTTNDKKSLVYIYKFPTRQFCKGIKFNTTHGFKVIGGTRNIVPHFDLEYQGIHIEFQGLIYIYNHLIGSVSNGTATIAPQYKHLLKECEELWKQYKIT